MKIAPQSWNATNKRRCVGYFYRQYVADLELYLYYIFPPINNQQSLLWTMLQMSSEMLSNTKRWGRIESQYWSWVPNSRTRCPNPVGWNREFNKVMWSLPNCLASTFSLFQEGIEIVTHANSCTIISSDPVVDDICVRLNSYLAELANYFRHARYMKISATKLTAKKGTQSTPLLKKPIGLSLGLSGVLDICYWSGGICWELNCFFSTGAITKTGLSELKSMPKL